LPFNVKHRPAKHFDFAQLTVPRENRPHTPGEIFIHNHGTGPRTPVRLSAPTRRIAPKSRGFQQTGRVSPDIPHGRQRIRTKLLKFFDSGLGNSGAVEAPGTQGADAALVLPRFVPFPPRFGDDPDACSTCFLQKIYRRIFFRPRDQPLLV
jgi:hypothetical protein